MASQLIRSIKPGLFCQHQLTRHIIRPVQTQTRVSLVQGQTTADKEFWSKNKELNRPMSPHLTIYKFELPAILSISHRATGLAASVVLYAGGIGAIFCNQSFPELLQLVQANVPHSLILLTKTALGGAIIYHTLNGVRHLIWDAGYGFQLKHLYMSGYFVVAMTAIGTAIVFIKG
jgi:succinate dehydrogenase (ubiquinone) cytochrome b560 subunit